MEKQAIPTPMQELLRPEAAVAAVVQRADLQRKGEESVLSLLNSMFRTPGVHLPLCAEPFHAAIEKEM